MLLIWNGNAFFHNVRIGGRDFGPDVRLASAALTLNVALILFGWRRYVELQHEAEMRAEQRAPGCGSCQAPTRSPASTIARALPTMPRSCWPPPRAGRGTVVISIQIQRFKPVNDQHGYDTGDELLTTIAGGADRCPWAARRSSRA